MHSIMRLVKLQESLYFPENYLVSTRAKVRGQHSDVVDICGRELGSTKHFSAEHGHENNR